MLRICNKIIEYCFYALVFLVPLTFTSNTSELFEFNKLWVTFGFTFVIFAAWATKMIIQKRFFIQKTPLDIPLGLFFLSQIISTLLSLDMHVSLWGYYSRFNGGLLSITSYIFLYYAFVSNFWENQQETVHTQTFERTVITPFKKPIILFASAAIVAILGVLISSQHASDTSDTIATHLFTLSLSAIIVFFLVAFATSGSVLKRLLLISVISCTFVAFWGFPSHFGMDPTCYLFRGAFDVSCWTDAFQPTVRIFSTLGQPDWLAAYLSVLIPLTMVYAITAAKKIKQLNRKNLLPIVGFLSLVMLFYADLLFSRARSGIIGNAIGLIVFFVLLFFARKKLSFPPKLFQKITLGFFGLFLIFTLLIGFSTNLFADFLALSQKLLPVASQPVPQPSTKTDAKQPTTPPPPVQEFGGTDSSKIRSIVWQGAFGIWKDNPLFGSGVETFAFAYYKYRPAAHNMTSEWDYLYNKAHNEYLNYLATTGAFGLGSYLFFIGFFLFLAIKQIVFSEKSSVSDTNILLTIALIAGYISILVSNFFGFSVVIVNIYFFLIPGLVFMLLHMLVPNKPIMHLFSKSEQVVKETKTISVGQWIGIAAVVIFSFWEILQLWSFWIADTKYYLGSNFDKIGQYQQGYTNMQEALKYRSDEPVFQDEMSSNNAILATVYAQQKDPATAGKLAQQAVTISDQLVQAYPNNTVFWKTRVRIFYTLSQLNPQYLPYALEAIKKTHEIAPSDAKISYNLGVIYGQNGKVDEAIKILENTIVLKPNYRDAYFALALFYRNKAVDKSEKIIHPEFEQKAVATLHYTLDHVAKDDKQAKDTLKSWGEK